MQSHDEGIEFKLLKGERYKNWPEFTLEVGEDGAVSNVRLVRSCGIERIDRQVLTAISRSKYRPRPRCGILETTIAFHIHW